MRFKVLLSGITSSRNRGVDALVRTNVILIKEFFPESDIVILSSDQNDKTAWSDLGVTVIILPKMPLVLRALRKLTLEYARGINQWYSRMLTPYLFDKLDVHIITGGDLFSSEYGDFTVWSNLIKQVDRIYHPITYLSAHSIGRFQCEQHEKEFQEILEKSTVISVRESVTERYLYERYATCMKDKGIFPIKNPDPAFILPYQSTDYTTAIRKEISEMKVRAPKKQVITLNVSTGIANFKGLSPEVIYQKRLELAHAILSQGIGLVLLAHVQGDDSLTNDVALCNQMKADLGRYEGQVISVNNGSSVELKEIIRTTDCLIAERMHAAIAGLSQQIPTIVISYSIKAEGILKDLFPIPTNYNKVYKPLTETVYRDVLADIQAGIEHIPCPETVHLQQYQKDVGIGYQTLAESVKNQRIAL